MVEQAVGSSGAFEQPSRAIASPARVVQMQTGAPLAASAPYPSAAIVEKIFGDITQIKAEGLVNPWNDNGLPLELQSSGGVAKAFKLAAGRKVFLALRKLEQNYPVDLGSLHCTGPGALRSNGVKAIFHPAIVHSPWGAKESSVRTATANILHLARQLDLKSIALPLMGAGHGGLSPEVSETIIRDQIFKSSYTGKVLIVGFAPPPQSLGDALISPLRGITSTLQLAILFAKDHLLRSPIYDRPNSALLTTAEEIARFVGTLSSKLSYHFRDTAHLHSCLPTLVNICRSFSRHARLEQFESWLKTDSFDLQTHPRSPVWLLANGKVSRVERYLERVSLEHDKTANRYGTFAPLLLENVDFIDLHRLFVLQRIAHPGEPFLQWLTQPYGDSARPTPLGQLLADRSAGLLAELTRVYRRRGISGSVHRKKT